MSDKHSADRLARAYTTEAISALVDVMRDPLAKGSERVAAANAILDRGHGKATQAVITVPAKGAAAQRLAQLSMDKLMAMIEAQGGMELLARRNAIDAEYKELPAPPDAIPAPPAAAPAAPLEPSAEDLI